MTGRPNRPHHQGSYARRARQLRTAAAANPTVTCWRCGRTWADYANEHGEKAAAWQAGHVNDGEIEGELRAEHARCNAQAGNRAREPRTERWW